MQTLVINHQNGNISKTPRDATTSQVSSSSFSTADAIPDEFADDFMVARP